MTIIRIKLSDLESAAKVREPGFMEAMFSAGREVGVCLEFTPDKHAELVAKWGKLTGNRGAGDFMARAFKPAAHLMDKTLGTHLDGCKGCGKRQTAMNKAIPF